MVTSGKATEQMVGWPENLPVGSYRLELIDASSCHEKVPLLVAPAKAFVGDFERGWLLAVQLYGIRSGRNWGIGDFTDLANLITLSAELGAEGVGLNPLHALFDDRPGDFSPYAPNSRLFLNALYIDVEKAPGFKGAPDRDALARVRQTHEVDYRSVAALKWPALQAAFAVFKTATGTAETPRNLRPIVPSVAHCWSASPRSKCCATGSRSRGGSGRPNGSSPITPNAWHCCRDRTRTKPASSCTCNGWPSGNCAAPRISPIGSA